MLEERGYRVNRVAGSSAGAIVGALITAGVSGTQLARILRKTDYTRFEDGPFYTRFLLGKALSILLRNGIHRGTYLTTWLEKQLAAHGATYRTGTFADLEYGDPDPVRALTAEQRSRLVVTASDLTAGRLRLPPPGRRRLRPHARSS